MLILGGIPSDRSVPAASGAVNIDPDAPPPIRGDFPLPVAGEEGSESGRLSRVPLAMSGGFWRDAGDAAGPDLADEPSEPDAADATVGTSGNTGQAGSSRQSADRTYVVENGDTWVKIARHTLGDGARWRELLTANAGASGGLRVGMRLVIPN
jgi:hypothetical protein